MQRALFAMVLVLAARGVVAAEPLLDEQNVNAQAVISALRPEASGSIGETRGIRRNDASPGSLGIVATAQPSIALLITFATNSSTLTPRARSALDKVADALRSQQLADYRFRIEGHADPRGSADANLKLSAERAASVVRYLSRADGIAPDRLVAIGKGSQELAKPDVPAAPENRRVTIVRLGE